MISSDVVTQWSKRRRHEGQVELAACRRLRALASRVPADQAIVELGVYQGRATGWLLLGAQEGVGAHVTAVDPWGLRRDGYSPDSGHYTHPAAYEGFRAHMDRIGAESSALTTKRGYARSVAAKWRGPTVGLLVHDAEHTAKAVEADLAAWLPRLAEDAAVVVHGASAPDVRAGVAAALGTGYEQGWRYTGPDGWAHGEPVLIPWVRRPGRRGLVVARRDPALLHPSVVTNTTSEPEPVGVIDPGGEADTEAPADDGPQQSEPTPGGREDDREQAPTVREDEPEDTWS